ncbi:MAG TPA: hypothetical protein PKH39_00460 [Woeseiaceae bacterium]|nr:hypothetical protein [Woeseiaceae bacterium]
MSEKKTTWARLQMLVIAAVFFGPLAIATWMYYTGAFAPDGRTNHGALLEPIINVVDELPESSIGELGDGYWLLIYVNDGACEADCEQALYTIRQSRKMLGREMERLLRVFLHGDTPPDTVFLSNEHAGLRTLSDSGLSALLNKKKPVQMAAGGYFLMDPLGNLVMYFEPDLDPSDMVEDIKRLLKLSRIG